MDDRAELKLACMWEEDGMEGSLRYRLESERWRRALVL